MELKVTNAITSEGETIELSTGAPDPSWDLDESFELEPRRLARDREKLAQLRERKKARTWRSKLRGMFGRSK